MAHSWHSKTGANRQWISQESDFKAKAVCARCNSGWMSALEKRAKPHLIPMIKGEKTTLSQSEGELCGLWALKTALMMEMAGPAAHRTFPGDYYKALYRTRRLPADLCVWIAASVVGKGFSADNVKLTADMANRLGAKDGNAMTLRIGHLVFNLLRVEMDDGEPLKIRGKFAAAVIRLWPGEGTVTWPPSEILSPFETDWFGGLVRTAAAPHDR